MKRSREQLIFQLKNEGLTFSSFTLTHEGNYAASDADWNYKDVPHLHHLHELVEAIISVVEDDKIATINMQKVFGINLPLTVFNYQSGSSSQIYYTTFLFFVLIVETAYEQVGPNRTRVSTTYSVGCSRLLKWCFPLIRWVIKRNYDNLMLADIPMRERRGQLRSWGYSFFKESPSYSFEKTMEILKPNVIPPESSTRFSPTTLSLDRDLPLDGEYLLGRDDHLGLRLVRSNNTIMIYPRLCPHEGASLDSQKCMNKKIKCPWHGRMFNPLVTLDASKDTPQEFITENHEITLSYKTLTIK